jgi:hypothetical protein
MFVITEIGRNIYRPYIYANDIFDFWIADTIGNLTGTITIIFFQLSIINPEHRMGRLLLLVIPAGLIIYELAQYFSPRSICDWKDMVATLIAGLISFGVYELLSHQFNNESIPQKEA